MCEQLQTEEDKMFWVRYFVFVDLGDFLNLNFKMKHFLVLLLVQMLTFLSPVGFGQNCL